MAPPSDIGAPAPPPEPVPPSGSELLLAQVVDRLDALLELLRANTDLRPKITRSELAPAKPYKEKVTNA